MPSCSHLCRGSCVAPDAPLLWTGSFRSTRVWPLVPHVSAGDHSLSGGGGRWASRGRVCPLDIKTKMKAFQKPVLSPGLPEETIEEETPLSSRPLFWKILWEGKFMPATTWVQPSHSRESVCWSSLPSGWLCGCRPSRPGPPLAGQGPTPIPGGDPACLPPP